VIDIRALFDKHMMSHSVDYLEDHAQPSTGSALDQYDKVVMKTSAWKEL
jgi:hypothetical protein